MKTEPTWILVGLAVLGLHAGMAAATRDASYPEECLGADLRPGGPGSAISCALPTCRTTTWCGMRPPVRSARSI